MERKRDFCIECRKQTAYDLIRRPLKQRIRDREYEFVVTAAVCAECGADMSLPGLIDENIQEIDRQYRMAERLVEIGDIRRLMKIYQIGKGPLSLALGFGEITITRYLAGQVPSKEYSDIMRHALSSPSYMKQMLLDNREKLADTAFHKAMSAAEGLEKLFSLSMKMQMAISYIFERLEEVTPLMLQKLLYFSQGVYSALYGKPLFGEECEAWVHGPVYPRVYNLFRDFKYNPIEDVRFAILEEKSDGLEPEERRVLELVIHSFGMYGGKVLEQITHNEEPWKEARGGYADGIPSHETVPKARIQEYYEKVDQEYGIGSEEGLGKYMEDMLKKDEK